MATSRETVHILGLGNLGKFFAHSLAKSNPNTPITLLFHRPSLATEWEKAGRCIEIVTNGIPDRQNGFSVEIIGGTEAKELRAIQNLIVATKTYATAPALMPLKQRLNSDTTLLFLQNGMGTMEEVNAALFPLLRFRPHYLAGIVNHGVYATGQFSAVHAGLASSTLGTVLWPSPKPEDIQIEKQSKYLAQLIQNAPTLAASLVSPDELLKVQLQKLAVNAIINPLTVIFDCFNGELFKSQSIAVLIQALLQEISAVLCAIMIANGTGPLPSFSKEGLNKTVADIGAKTAKNISSMRQDVLAGRKTEIDYINGYIIARGITFGIECPLNRTLFKMVKDKTVISDSEISQAFGI